MGKRVGEFFQNKEKTVACVFFVALLIYIFWKIRLGLHWDESDAIEQGVMVLKGSKMIAENWSPLQLTAVVISPLLAVYRFFHGDLVGVMLAMRYVYLIFQTLIALYMYFSLKREYGEKTAYLVSLMHFVYFFNWMSITYKSMLYMGGMVTIISLYNYLRKEKKCYLIFAGGATIYIILGYPHAIIIYIAFALALWKLDKKENRWTGICVYTLVCACLGCAVIVYIIWQSKDVHALMIGLQGMLSDEGHSESLFRKIARLVLPILGLAVAENLLAYLFDKRLRRNETLERNNGWLYAALFTVILAVVCLLRIQSAGPSRFWYILLAMFLLFPVFLKDVNAEAYQTEIYLFIIPAIVAMLAIVLATNQGIAIVSYGCVWGLMGLVLILRKVSSEYRQIDTFVIGAMCFMFLFFCPDKAGGSTNIFWQRELITEGSAKGLYAQESTVEEYCSVCDVVEKYANSDEKLLVISDYTANAYTNTLAIEATFSPDYVSPWSERYNYFYELYPSQMPSVIILDENYIGNVEEYLANSPLGEMIHSNYDYENYIRDGRYGIIYEKCN